MSIAFLFLIAGLVSGVLIAFAFAVVLLVLMLTPEEHITGI